MRIIFLMSDKKDAIQKQEPVSEKQPTNKLLNLDAKYLLMGIPLAIAVGFFSSSMIANVGQSDRMASIEKELTSIRLSSKNGESVTPFLPGKQNDKIAGVKTSQPSKKLIDNLRSINAEFVEYLDLSEDQQVNGLIGVKVSLPGNQMMPLFVTLDEQHLVPAIINMQTRANLVEELSIDMMMGANERLSVDKDWDRLAEANYIAMGSDNPSRIVYVSHDPYCPHCNRLWLDKEKAGIPEGTQVRLILVGMQGSQSNHVAAYWFDLQAKGGDVIASIREHELLRSNGNTAGIHSKITVSNLSDESVAKDAFNKKHLMAFGAYGTPTLFYKDLKTGEANMLPGRPKDLSTLKEILGHN